MFCPLRHRDWIFVVEFDGIGIAAIGVNVIGFCWSVCSVNMEFDIGEGQRSSRVHSPEKLLWFNFRHHVQEPQTRGLRPRQCTPTNFKLALVNWLIQWLKLLGHNNVVLLIFGSLVVSVSADWVVWKCFLEVCRGISVCTIPFHRCSFFQCQWHRYLSKRNFWLEHRRQ